MVIIIITIILGISYLIFSYESPTSLVKSTTPVVTIAPKIYNSNNNTYEEFNGRCLTKSGLTPDNYQKINTSFLDCNINCNNNTNCQAYSYVLANSINNNQSLCTIYSNYSSDSLNLPGFNYNSGQDKSSAITMGDNEKFYTCYHRL